MSRLWREEWKTHVEEKQFQDQREWPVIFYRLLLSQTGILHRALKLIWFPRALGQFGVWISLHVHFDFKAWKMTTLLYSYHCLYLDWPFAQFKNIFLWFLLCCCSPSQTIAVMDSFKEEFPLILSLFLHIRKRHAVIELCIFLTLLLYDKKILNTIYRCKFAKYNVAGKQSNCKNWCAHPLKDVKIKATLWFMKIKLKFASVQIFIYFSGPLGFILGLLWDWQFFVKNHIQCNKSNHISESKCVTYIIKKFQN